MPTTNSSLSETDVILVGAGIMSATLAVLLKELDPNLKIDLFEVLCSAAQESSNAWNNAGTGHAALCELNYTPEKSDGGRLINDEPWQRAYVVFKQGADTHFVPDPSETARGADAAEGAASGSSR